MATPQNFLDGVIENQAAMRPKAEDANPWLARCIFIPFRDRSLSLLQMGLLGGLTELKAGYVLPLIRYKRPDIDYAEIDRVPKDSENNYRPVPEGVSTITLKDRSPYAVVEAVYRIFNPFHGADPSMDNGICEVEALRGNDDMMLVRDLNNFCLPERYDIARLQIAQLEQAVRQASDGLFETVAETLLAATVQSVEWAKWHYMNLEADMEDRKRSGKDRLSPLNVAVCKWIEKPAPKFRSNLTGEAQPVVAQGQMPAQPGHRPAIQCYACGEFANLLPDGAPPKMGCRACGSPTFGRDPEPAESEPVENEPLESAPPTQTAPIMEPIEDAPPKPKSTRGK